MLNKDNFIPQKNDIQPEFYVQYFNNWAAVFRHPNGRNILLVVDTLINRSLAVQKGDPVIQYQGKKCRHLIPHGRFTTLRAALDRIRELFALKDYGLNEEDQPVAPEEIRKTHAVTPNKTLLKREIAAYRKLCRYYKPRKPFVLTEDERKAILKDGWRETEADQIEECANKSIYILDNGTEGARPIRIEEAIELLGRPTFLSGISRSTFHWGSLRETADGKHSVTFESGRLSPFRKND